MKLRKELRPFQDTGVKDIWKFNGRALLADEMGCVSGDCRVQINRCSKSMSYTLREFFLAFNSGFPKKAPTYVRSLNERTNSVQLNEVKKVLFQGFKKVISIRVGLGCLIQLTEDHLVKTYGGWVAAGKLKKGDLIAVENPRPQKSKNKKSKIRYLLRMVPDWYPFGHTTLSRGKKIRRREVHILVAEASLNNFRSVNRYLDFLYSKSSPRGLKLINPKTHHVHHVDGDSYNNNRSNLQILKREDHWKIHGKFENFNQGKISFSKITLIKKLGVTDVYDLVCADPHRNFSCNNIIVHNCGKTPQAIVAAYGYNKWPVIIICPASLRFNWKREWLEWIPDIRESDICVLTKKKQPIGGKIIITSYEIASALVIELCSLAPACVILDEAQYIKNTKAKRTNALVPLCRHAKNCFLLTGTPVLNRPIELFAQLVALGVMVLEDWYKYARRYCAMKAKKGRFGWDDSGASNLTELNYKLKKLCMIRRLKADVLPELPPKERVRLIVEPVVVPSDESVVAEVTMAFNKCRRNRAETIAFLKKNYQKLSGFLFKEYALMGMHKAPIAAEWLLETAASEKPIVVFAHHKNTLNVICAALSAAKIKWIRIDGKTPAAERLPLVDKFQRGEVSVAVLSITAASTGLTLTAAQDMLVVELPFGPGLAGQAEDRIHRIGQKNAALIRYMISERSLDEYLWKMINKKSAIASEALDGVAVSRFADAQEQVSTNAGLWALVNEILDQLSSSRNLELI